MSNDPLDPTEKGFEEDMAFLEGLEGPLDKTPEGLIYEFMYLLQISG